MNAVRKSYVDTSGGQIHVTSIAGGSMPAIFLHQTARSGRIWLKCSDRLAGMRGLHAFDTGV